MIKTQPTNAGDISWIPRLQISPEEESATQSSILTWEIPWTEEPDGPQSMGSHRVKRG